MYIGTILTWSGAVKSRIARLQPRRLGTEGWCREPWRWVSKPDGPGQAKEHLIVDGGVLSNFPVWLFDSDGEPPTHSPPSPAGPAQEPDRQGSNVLKHRSRS